MAAYRAEAALNLILVLVLGIPCAVLLIAAVVVACRTASRAFDAAGTRVEHLILAPVKRFVWFEGVPLTKIPCKACGGLAVQALLGGAWTIIPAELRNRQIDGSHPRLANTRRCPRCHGLGHKWVRIT